MPKFPTVAFVGLTAVLLLVFAPAFGKDSGGGYGTSGGGDSTAGPGCCNAINKLTKGDPPDVRDATAQVYTLLMQMKSVEFAVLMANTNDACNQIQCGILNRDRVRNVIAIAADDRPRVESYRIAWFAAAAAITSAVVALCGLVLSIVANRRSRRNEREIKRIEQDNGLGAA